MRNNDTTPRTTYASPDGRLKVEYHGPGAYLLLCDDQPAGFHRSGGLAEQAGLVWLEEQAAEVEAAEPCAHCDEPATAVVEDHDDSGPVRLAVCDACKAEYTHFAMLHEAEAEAPMWWPTRMDEARPSAQAPRHVRLLRAALAQPTLRDGLIERAGEA